MSFHQSQSWSVDDCRALVQHTDAIASEWTLARTVAIYALAEGGAPVARGSGVLLQVADTAFLLSAGHVLDIDSDRTLLISTGVTGRRPISLHGHQAHVAADQELLDLGFVRLSPDVFRALVDCSKTFLRLDEVDLQCELEKDAWYSVAGFPQQYVETDHGKQTIRSNSIHYSTHAYLDKLDVARDGVTVALTFFRSGNADVQGEPARIPELQGISGCGIWRTITADELRGKKEWDRSSMRLIGIEHGVIANKAIIGAFARHLLAAIWLANPDLRAAMDLVRSRREVRDRQP